MLIVTKQGKKILFDRLDDLRGYVDENILEAISEVYKLDEDTEMEDKIDDLNDMINKLGECIECRDIMLSDAVSTLRDLIKLVKEDMEEGKDPYKEIKYILGELEELKGDLV